MNLYFIRRKSDGAYLRSHEAHYSAHVQQDKTAWSSAPAYMLRTPDGVAANIKKLCMTPRKTKGGWGIEWVDFKPEQAELYEVVVQSITINGERVEPATSFLDEAIRAQIQERGDD